MKIKILREKEIEYKINLEDATLLECLNVIKSEQDKTLCYSSGCRSGVCGSCSVLVNDKEVLSCSHKAKDGDRVEPLRNAKIIRDLVINMDEPYSFNAKAKAWQNSIVNIVSLNHEDEKINEIQSDCILCGSCYSACPVYSVNTEFLGPFALTRAWKYISDKRENDKKTQLDAVQNNGIWDCTLCNECTIVCPQNISSKADIEKLRSKSVMAEYSDPNFLSFNNGLDGSPSF